MNDLLDVEQFSIHKLYHQLRGHYDKVPRRWMVCNNSGASKWIFLLILATHNKLYAKDRLEKWGRNVNLICLLCNVQEESVNN